MNHWLEALNDEHARHALLVHLPITLSIVGALPLIALAIGGFKNKTLKWVCIGCFTIASAGGYFAMEAGEDATKHIYQEHNPRPTQAEREAIHEHDELGEKVWIWAILPAVLIGVSLVPKRKIAVTAGALGLAAGLWSGVWVVRTGDAGGRLVYAWGLGTPDRGETADGSFSHTGNTELNADQGAELNDDDDDDD